MRRSGNWVLAEALPKEYVLEFMYLELEGRPNFWEME